MATAGSGAAVPSGQQPRHHPYFPPGVAIPNYAPNTKPLWLLFASFLSALGAFLTAAFIVARLAKPQFRFASLSDKALFVWFTMCTSLTSVFDLYSIHTDSILP